MPIFDSHCHYNLEPIFSDWKMHWVKAQNIGVTKSIIVGVDLESSQRAIALANEIPSFFAAVGIHPSEWQELPEQNFSSTISQLEQLLSLPNIRAIGETGLDYYRLDTENSINIIKLQQQSLRTHIQLAINRKLPLILHVRDKYIPETPVTNNAYWDTLSILEEFSSYELKFVLHCVSGPIQYIKSALNLGAYLGVARNVTYKNADHIRTLVNNSPIERLVIETDAPFLPPLLYRGKDCEPWMISETEKFLKFNLNLDTDLIYKNTNHFFLDQYAENMS